MSLFEEALIHRARLLLDDFRQRQWTLATAESCTGGLVAGLLTEVAGSSDVVERGFVTYSNRAKSDLLGVPGDMIADFGAVSEPVARAMAEGALEESRANIAVSITGVAGPGGGTRFKPVGLVHFATATENGPVKHERHEFGDLGRTAVRLAAVEVALTMLSDGLG